MGIAARTPAPGHEPSPMTVRYDQSRERSAELLRATLRLLGQHEVCCNPVSFAVWYEHAAGINGRLSQATDRLLKATPKLDDAAMRQLYRDHVLEPDHVQVGQISTELQQLMTGVAENAHHTGDRAGAFGLQVDGLAQALQAEDIGAVAPLLASVSASAHALKDTSKALAEQVANSRLEIERLRADLVRARDEALQDPLTKVFNRKGFDQQVDALLRTAPAPGLSHGLVMIDIDHFKSINDTHGHVFGDQVLRGLAEVMRACVTDPRCSIARYGGEEFAILLPDSSLADGVRTAERVRQRIKAMKIRDRRTQAVILRVTVSGGVTTLVDGDDPSSWIGRADAALYKAKQSGRDQVSSC